MQRHMNQTFNLCVLIFVLQERVGLYETHQYVAQGLDPSGLNTWY